MVKEILILIPDDLQMDEHGEITGDSGSYSVNANGTIPERLFQQGTFLIAAGAFLREQQQQIKQTNGKASK